MMREDGMPTYTFGEQGHEHRTLVYRVGDAYLAICYCGMQWTYGRERDEAYMQSVWESHLKYFTRKPLETL